jgi:hypothetical protein
LISIVGTAWRIHTYVRHDTCVSYMSPCESHRSGKELSEMILCLYTTSLLRMPRPVQNSNLQTKSRATSAVGRRDDIAPKFVWSCSLLIFFYCLNLISENEYFIFVIYWLRAVTFGLRTQFGLWYRYMVGLIWAHFATPSSSHCKVPLHAVISHLFIQWMFWQKNKTPCHWLLTGPKYFETRPVTHQAHFNAM